MKKSQFTPEQIKLLRENKNTRSVSTFQIRFTDAFRQKFWEQYLKGLTPVEIFTDAGYDPDIVGRHRISNFAFHVKNSHMNQNSADSASEVAELRGEVARLRFEIDSLKKIIKLANSPSSRD